MDEPTEFCAWLDHWWYLTSEWLHDPYPLDNSGSQQLNKWDTLAHQGAILPDHWSGIDLSPMKDLLFAMLSYGDPVPQHGSKKSLDQIHDIAAKAWRTKERFDHVRQQRLREQKSAQRRLVTSAEIARFVDIEAKSLVKTTWCDPATPAKGQHPAEFDWDELRPALEHQYPRLNWNEF